jgi:hypothetical protein
MLINQYHDERSQHSDYFFVPKTEAIIHVILIPEDHDNTYSRGAWQLAEFLEHSLMYATIIPLWDLLDFSGGFLSDWAAAHLHPPPHGTRIQNLVYFGEAPLPNHLHAAITRPERNDFRHRHPRAAPTGLLIISPELGGGD